MKESSNLVTAFVDAIYDSSELMQVSGERCFCPSLHIKASKQDVVTIHLYSSCSTATSTPALPLQEVVSNL